MKSFEKIGGKILAGVLSFAALISPLSPAVGAMKRVIRDESEVSEVSINFLDVFYENSLHITPEKLASISGAYSVTDTSPSGMLKQWVFNFDECTLTMDRMASASSLRKYLEKFSQLASNDYEQQECRSILDSIPDDINASLHFTINSKGVVSIVVEPISRSIVLHSDKPLDKRELWGTYRLYKYIVDNGMASLIPDVSL